MKNYARILLIGLMALTLAYHGARRIGWSAGERDSLTEMMETQLATGGLYMGLIHSPADYKLALYGRLKPEVAVIGSSRAMKFPQSYFSRPLYNLGGLVYSTGQALGLMREMAEIHRPRLIIYTVDFWTLCAFPGSDPMVPPAIPERASAPHWPSQVNRLRLVFDLLADGRLSSGKAVDLLIGTHPDQIDGIALQGLTAVLQAYGFGVDGAIYPAQPAVVQPPRADGKPVWFDATHRKITHGEGQYPLGCRPYPAAMAQLHQMRTEARDLGISLVLLAPPVAGAALDDMEAQTGSTGYIRAWLVDMAAVKDPLTVLAHDGRDFGSGDDEFEDGIHGGFVTHARLLQVMAGQLPALAELLDLNMVRRVVACHAGRAKLTFQDLRRLAASEGGRTDECGADKP